jgi:hypothetical protein
MHTRTHNKYNTSTAQSVASLILCTQQCTNKTWQETVKNKFRNTSIIISLSCLKSNIHRSKDAK